MVSKLYVQTKGSIRTPYHKQQRRDKPGTQLNKSTTQKMTKMRLTNLQQLQG